MIDQIDWSHVVKNGIDKHISSNTPVIICDIDESLPLMRWSLTRIIDEYGKTMIRVLKSKSQYFSYTDKKEREIVQMSLANFFERAVLDPGGDGFYYTLGRSPVDQFEGFTGHMSLPYSLAKIVDGKLRRPERNIWISPKGTRTALHFDAVDNLNLQIEGSKNFLLYPPGISGMHPYHWSSQAAYVSSIDPRSNLNANGFPYEKGVSVQIERGQMLYLPYGWWHQVDTTGDRNLNANFWWFPHLKLVAFPQQMLRGAAVLINRFGQHPHKRAEKIKNVTSSTS